MLLVAALPFDGVTSTALPAGCALERIRATFCLSVTRLGALFATDRATAMSWLDVGAPGHATGTVDDVAAVADFLALRVDRDTSAMRIDEPVASFAGRTLYEVLRSEDATSALATYTDAFALHRAPAA